MADLPTLPTETIGPEIPKGFDALGKPNVPSSYEIVAIKLTNNDGEEVDLFEKRVITKIVIIEELTRPIIFVNLNIYDNIDFFNTYKLQGNENIELDILCKENEGGQKEKNIKLSLTVYDYPGYIKSGIGINVQEYSMQCISPYAVTSKLQSISYSVKDSPIDEIIKICDTNLGISADQIEIGESKNIADFKGVITYRTPLEAIEFLRKLSYDSSITPIFFYPRIKDLDNKVLYLTAWSDILNEPIYESGGATPEYLFGVNTTEEIGSPGYLKFLRTKILDIMSKINLNFLSQAKTGLYGSLIRIKNYASKQYVQNTYVPDSGGGVKLSEATKLPLLTEKGEPEQFRTPPAFNPNDPADIAKSNQINIDVGIEKTDTRQPSNQDLKAYNSAYLNYFYATFSHQQIEIVVYGDYNLNPGVKIKISIPPAKDPDEDIPESSSTVDETLSGEYIIIKTSHTFEHGTYTTRLTMIKPPETTG